MNYSVFSTLSSCLVFANLTIKTPLLTFFPGFKMISVSGVCVKDVVYRDF